MAEDKYESLWSQITETVKTYENIDSSQINAFFGRLHPQAFSEGFLMLTAETDFIKGWIESHYLNVIKQALQDTHGVPFTVSIEVDSSITSQPTSSDQPSSQTNQQAAQATHTTQPSSQSSQITSQHPLAQQGISPQQPSTPTSPPINKNKHSPISTLTFKNFVIGASNTLAYSMAVAVAEAPGDSPQLNPLFIYGKSGLGKTHLLRAIQNYIIGAYPEMKTVFVDAHTLVDDYSNASRTRSFKDFHDHYHNADILLIDDVQGLTGKTETINQVFQIFNEMMDKGRQVVFAADRAPKNIDLEERYQSRFNSGCKCNIQPPELETKIGIIRNSIDNYRILRPNDEFEISEEIQEYIADISGSNIRELISAVTFIIVDAVNSGESSVNKVSSLLQDHFNGGGVNRINIEDIQSAVEEYYHISHNELVGKKRNANITHARQMGIYLCRTLIDIPFQAIGEAFNRDHTTAMYSYNTIENRMKESIEMKGEIENLVQIINDR